MTSRKVVRAFLYIDLEGRELRWMAFVAGACEETDDILRANENGLVD